MTRRHSLTSSRVPAPSRQADDMELVGRVVDRVATDIADAALDRVADVLVASGLRFNRDRLEDGLRDAIHEHVAEIALEMVQARVREIRSHPAAVARLRITTRETLLSLLREP